MGGKECCETVFWTPHAASLTSALQLWLAERDLPRIRPVSVFSWMGEGLRLMRLHSFLRDCWQFVAFGERGAAVFRGGAGDKVVQAPVGNTQVVAESSSPPRQWLAGNVLKKLHQHCPVMSRAQLLDCFAGCTQYLHAKALGT